MVTLTQSEYDALSSKDSNTLYSGGSVVDNQAMFDKNGKPLESLNVFKYIYTGSWYININANKVVMGWKRL